MIIIMMMDGVDDHHNDDGVDDHHNDDDDDSQAMTGHTDHILSLYTWGGAMFVRFTSILFIAITIIILMFIQL